MKAIQLKIGDKFIYNNINHTIIDLIYYNKDNNMDIVFEDSTTITVNKNKIFSLSS